MSLINNIKKLEIILMTLREYEETPLSFLSHYYRDGWEVVSIEKKEKVVVMAKEYMGGNNGEARDNSF